MSQENDESKIQKVIKGPTLGYTDNFPKRQMWKEIADEQHGEFKIRFNSGNELEIHNISIPYKKWNIEISVSDTRPLKFRVFFASLQHFYFMISQRDFIDGIFKKFSRQRIESGWKEFDKQFIIKSNRPHFVKEMFPVEIQKTILKHNIYSISCQTDKKSEKMELFSVIQRQAGEKEMIFEIIEMFKKIMDNLEKLKIIK